MGRRRGQVHPNSIQARVLCLEVGGVLYIETTREKYGHVQREWNIAKTRRVPEMKDYIIECTAWQAVSVSTMCEPIVLVRVERVA